MPRQQKDGRPAFRKFKLVPADDGFVQRDTAAIEKELRHYDPTSRAIANLYGGMEDALFNRKAKRSDEDRLNLLAANRARIQYLNSRRMVSETPPDIRHQPAKVTNHHEATVESNAEPEAAFASSDVNTDGKVEEWEKEDQKIDNYEDGMKDQNIEMSPATVDTFLIPTNHDAKFAQLMDKISGVIGSNKYGEVVIRGQSVPNTSFSDVMRALYVDSNFNIPGLTHVVKELKRLDVSPRLFTSRRARSMFSGSPSSEATAGVIKSSGKTRNQKRSIPRVLRLY